MFRADETAVFVKEQVTVWYKKYITLLTGDSGFRLSCISLYDDNTGQGNQVQLLIL